MTKIFVSYCHEQGDWVFERLVPCLKASGAEVLVDQERFKTGTAIIGQMDALQAEADRHVLVFSPDYLSSDYCKHEMKQAFSLDPEFQQGVVHPIVRVKCPLPSDMIDTNPLFADLSDDSNALVWRQLLRGCGLCLGVSAPIWFAALDQCDRYLQRRQSVNLTTTGALAKPLFEQLRSAAFPDLGVIDLDSGTTNTRPGLLQAMLRALGRRIPSLRRPNDLTEFEKQICPDFPVRLAVLHFDHAQHRPEYDIDLFCCLRYLIMRQRALTLLVQSRVPFTSLIPRDHPLSEIDIRTVELRPDP